MCVEQNRSPDGSGFPGLGIYVHIPFCRAKCAYCDFNSFSGCEPLFAPYLMALRAEMRLVQERYHLDAPYLARTLYFGGGTPTVLQTDGLALLVREARHSFCVPPEGEVTVEANPGTVDRAMLLDLRAVGVNRLSLGIQSFDDEMLRLLGRIHTVGQARQAVLDAQQAGFDNLNLDLLFGVPRQTMQTWQESVRRALDLSPQHLSFYALTLEEGTLLVQRIRAGELAMPDDDLAADMYEWAVETLAQAGYVHYEISNWAQPGYLCHHNLIYWRNQPYIGLGAGAHSWYQGRRWANLAKPHEYISSLAKKEWPIAQVEEIDRALEMGETMMMGLRLLQEGVSFARFETRFGLSMREVYPVQMADLQEQGLLEWDTRRVRLTERGCLLGNQVFAQFLPG